MFRRIFSVFLDSYTESLKLKDSYRRLTTRLGWLAVAVGCLVLIAIMYHGWLMFGLPLEGGNIEGLRLKLIAWVALTILFVPIAFYAGMLAIYGTCGLLLLVIGRLSWRQALDFAMRARYPRQWYRPNA